VAKAIKGQRWAADMLDISNKYEPADLIATAAKASVGLQQAKQNAQLIAMAPELLKALMECVDSLEKISKHDKHALTARDMSRLFDAMRVSNLATRKVL